MSGVLAVTMSAGALALLLWPMPVPMPVPVPMPGAAGPGRRRVPAGPAATGTVTGRAVRGRHISGAAARWAAGFGHPGRAGPVPAAVAGGLLGLLVSWPCAVAAALLGATAFTLAHRSVLRARQHQELAAAAAALDALGRELDSGAAPVDALLAVVETAPARMAALFEALAGQRPPPAVVYPEVEDARVGRGGSRVARGPAGHRGADVCADEVGAGLVAGWSLCRRHGIPLAAVVHALAADAHDRRRAAQQKSAQVAGPAVSGYVLSALPAAGLLLGTGMGADPLAVLTGSAWGGALLIAGASLCCAGLLWTDRIVRR